MNCLFSLCTLRMGSPSQPPDIASSQPTAPVATAVTRPVITPPLTPTVTPTPIIPDTGWVLLRPGLERRRINLLDEEGQHLETIYLLRLDPTLFRFDVAYQPTDPRTLAEWQAETGALIVLNAGYYREEEERLLPNGLAIINGQPLGQSFGDFAGMFVIPQSGPPDVRWLRQRPYDPAEPLWAAVQSFPLLVKPGGELGFPAEFEDDRRARRTVLAQDRTGRILFLVTSEGHFTLHTLSRYLSESDLALDIALNLDGGTSSGILLDDPAEEVPALLPLPWVIMVYEGE